MKYQVCAGCGGDGALDVLRGDEQVGRETCGHCFGSGRVRLDGCAECRGWGLRVQAKKLDGTHVLVRCKPCGGTGGAAKEAA